jgi:predicted dehydrogenase
MRRSGKLLQVGHQRRSNPRYRHVAEKVLAEAKLLGRITGVQSQWALPWTEARGAPRRALIPEEELAKFGYASMHEFRNWRWYSKYCCNPFCSFVTHQLDICRWYLDAIPQRVTALGDSSVYPDRPCLDNVMAIYEFNGPAGKTLVTSQLLTASSGGGTQHFERFLGTDGSIQMSLDPRWIRLGREATAPDWDDWVRQRIVTRPDSGPTPDPTTEPAEVRVSSEIELYTLPVTTSDPYCQPHLVNFFQAVRGEAALTCPADVAFPSHVAAVKTVAAAIAGQPLTLATEDFET